MTVYPGIVFKDGDPIIGSLNAEIICLRKLIDSTRSGFIKMAEENIQLHLDIDVFKDENEALQRLLDVFKDENEALQRLLKVD